jgi:hypothetical protein
MRGCQDKLVKAMHPNLNIISDTIEKRKRDDSSIPSFRSFANTREQFVALKPAVSSSAHGEGSGMNMFVSVRYAVSVMNMFMGPRSHTAFHPFLGGDIWLRQQRKWIPSYRKRYWKLFKVHILSFENMQ